MSNDLALKKYPVTTDEVGKMLNFKGSDEHSQPSLIMPEPGLPVSDLHAAPVDAPIQHKGLTVPVPDRIASHHVELPQTADEKKFPVEAFVKTGRAVLPYAVVFILGIFLYFFFFSKFNFGSLLNFQTTQSITPKESALQQLEKRESTAYQAWIKSFYYDVSDQKVLDPEVDNSGNGLSNFQKYLLNLNPKSYDTLGIGLADSQALAQGIDPVTGGTITDDQKNIISKYVDMEVVMNLLTLFNLQNPPRVAGAGINADGLPLNPRAANTDSAYQYNPPVNPGQGFGSLPNSGIDINTSVPGRLEIPSLKVNAPLMWTDDPKNFDRDLESGVVHYPGTALPGEMGTAYISGHSSNYVWAKGNYNHIFTYLGNLANNTSFKITVVQKNGRNAIFHYVVTGSKQFTATDQAQFQNTGKSMVALSTCWPVGSTAKRLVVFGELTQTEQ